MKFLRNIFSLGIPTIFLTLLTVLRFLPRDMRPLFVSMTSWQFGLTILAILVLTIRLYLLLKTEGLIKSKEQENPMLLKIRKLVFLYNFFIKKVQVNSFRVLAESLKFNLTLLALVRKLEKIMYTGKYIVLICCLEILPKLLLLVLFLGDIFIFKQFYYFYKGLPLLLIPVFFSVIKTLIIRLYADNFEHKLDYLTFKPCIMPGSEEYYSFRFKTHKRIPSFITSLGDFVENHFTALFDIFYLYLNYIRTQKDNHFNKIHIFLTLCYILGWTTILVGSILAA